MTVWNGNHYITTGTLRALRDQARGLQQVRCTIEAFAELNDGRGMVTEEAANTYNGKCFVTLKKGLLWLFELVRVRHIQSPSSPHPVPRWSLLVANHDDLCEEERRTDAMVFDVSCSTEGAFEGAFNFNGPHRIQSKTIDGWDLTAPWLMQNLHLWLTKYQERPNGLQELLDRISIRNRFPHNLAIKLTGKEALAQKLELLHLIHVTCGRPGATAGRDANPLNTALGNKWANLMGKRCSQYPWKICQCVIECYPQGARARLFTRARFELDVKIELIKGPLGNFPNSGTEEEVRMELRDAYQACLDHYELEAPAWLSADEDLLDSHYAELVEICPRARLDAFPTGILVPGTNQRVRFQDLVSQQRDIPVGFLNDLERELEPLVPIRCPLNPPNAALQRKVDAFNKDVHGRMLAMRQIIIRAVRGGITSEMRGATEDERSSGALFLRDIALANGSQQLTLAATSEWSGSLQGVVNPWAAEHAADFMQPTGPVCTLMAKLFVDNYEYLRAQGGDQGAVHALQRLVSIVAPAGGLDHELVMAQWVEASHRYHLAWDETVEARDCNTDNMTPESKLDNGARAICGVRPELACRGQCFCGPTPCAAALFKLADENRFNLVVLSDFTNGQFSGGVVKSEDRIRAGLVRSYSDIFRQRDMALPPFLQAYGGGESESVAKIVYTCDLCREPSLIYANAASCCESPPAANEGGRAAQAVAAVRTVRGSRDFTLQDDHELLRAILEWGYGQQGAGWAFIAERLSYRPADNNVLRNRAKGGRFTKKCLGAAPGITLSRFEELIKQCKGSKFGSPTTTGKAILELAFPTWKAPKDGCPRLTELGGELDPDFSTYPEPEEGKFNPCYYTKAFAGLDPMLGGYPTPIDTKYPYEFAAPYMKQPGDGSTHHCEYDAVDVGACPKIGAECGPDCAIISDDYGIGHIPPFVALAAVKNGYNSCKHDVCAEWFDFDTSGCNIVKSKLDELVIEYFGADDDTTIKFQPPILIDGEPSSTYYRLEYLGQSPDCDEGNCRGPHYCTKEVADAGNIWGDFCPYVQTGENSGQYRHPHLALAALELWMANQCLPEQCPSEWLESPAGQGYGTDSSKTTSITWAEMEDNEDPMAQPAVPYVWPNSGSGIYPGHEALYGDLEMKDIEGAFVAEGIAYTEPETTTSTTTAAATTSSTSSTTTEPEETTSTTVATTTSSALPMNPIEPEPENPIEPEPVNPIEPEPSVLDSSSFAISGSLAAAIVALIGFIAL